VRGQVCPAGPGHGVPVSAAYRVSGPVPALLHDDPLFLGLCAAFDDLLGPVVTALDCFAAYLDPWLAPDDFVAWLATLVGAGDDAPGAQAEPAQPGEPGARQRARVAGAVRGYRARGTAAGLRDAVAAAAGVPADQVSVAESGAVTWSATSGTAQPPPFDPVVTVTVAVPGGREHDAVAACARAAAEPVLPVFGQLRIETVRQ